MSERSERIIDRAAGELICGPGLVARGRGLGTIVTNVEGARA